MLGKATRSRLAAAALIAVAGLAAPLVAAAPVQAADRQRAESPHDTASPKEAVASCPGGQEVIGASGRIKDGNGGVRLAAIVPGRRTVTVRGEAFADHEGAWSVIAAAICAPASDTLTQTATIESGTPTATCPNGTDVAGGGFSLPTNAVLTGLIPDVGARTVTVRTPMIVIGGPRPIAYAICVPQMSPFYTRSFDESSPTDSSAPKLVTAGGTSDWDRPELSGVGGAITWVDGPGLPVGRSDVFIDTLMLSSDLLTMTMQAVDRTPPAPALMVDPEDQWSATAYALAPYYY